MCSPAQCKFTVLNNISLHFLSCVFLMPVCRSAVVETAAGLLT